jgi:hypothetical protein
MIEEPNTITPVQRELFDRIDEINAGRKCAQAMHAAIESLAMFINHIDGKGAGTFFGLACLDWLHIHQFRQHQ